MALACLQVRVDMNIYMEPYKGIAAVTIENEVLQLTVLPELGAKIASLIYKPQNFEVFFQPADNEYRLSSYAANFADYDTAGADEMYPTIDACTYPYEGYTGTSLPDHGDLWSIPWRVLTTDKQLLAQVSGPSLPYEFTRRITLVNNQVHLQYQLKNCGDIPLYGIWAFHGLTACDESSQIILPGTDRVVNVHNSDLLGPAGTKHSFPEAVSLAGDTCRIDRIRPRASNTTAKFYIDGKNRRGKAALTLNHNRLLYQLLFPADCIPYLGVWVNQGGFKGEYNCALEPTNGFYDSLVTTQQLGSLAPVAPGNVLAWYLIINLEAVS